MSERSTDVDIELAVRRYLGRLARRYTPLLVVGVTLALILVLVRPATTPKNNAVSSGASSSGTPGETVPGQTAGPVAGGSSAAPAGSTSRGAAQSVAVPRGVTPAAAAGSAGVTRSGVQCGPGVRQVTWSV